MNFDMLTGSLKTLSRLLEIHFGRREILLIDEYDVPLAKAHEKGYYDQMVTLIRNLFEQGLKTNSSLEMAVLTGTKCSPAWQRPEHFLCVLES